MENQPDSVPVSIPLTNLTPNATPPLTIPSDPNPISPATPVPVVALPCTDLTQMQEPVIEFGVGGGIPPRSIQIFADGKLTVEGTTIQKQTLSPLTVKALLQLADAENFWTLPEFTTREFSGHLAFNFVKITLPCTNRRVEVRGSAEEGPFAEFFSLLLELVGFSYFA